MKPRKSVRWQPPAREDLAEIVAYIAQQSDLRTADRFAGRLIERVDDLAFFPYAGEVCPYFRKARQLPFGHFVIYYTIHRKEVVIRAVVRGARLFRSWWLRRGE